MELQVQKKKEPTFILEYLNKRVLFVYIILTFDDNEVIGGVLKIGLP